MKRTTRISLVITLSLLPLAAHAQKAKPKPVDTTTAMEASTAAEVKASPMPVATTVIEASHKQGTQLSKALRSDLKVQTFEIAGKDVQFLWNKNVMKAAGASWIDPTEKLPATATAVDVQIGEKANNPVFIRLYDADKKSLSLQDVERFLKSPAFGEVMPLFSSVGVQSCAKPLECCERDGNDNCTRECCPKD
ncbi:MAG TPA: hypothetical protein VN605_01450 [Thermoanaerobaculia bacterium]|nr:hypothetical protein [Thermoanaerobaculia bacterium]